MEIIKKRIADMERAEYNPRVELMPGDDEYEKLKRNIERFGMVVPVIWNGRTNRVVSGHQRLTVLMNEGVTEVDVSVVDLTARLSRTTTYAEICYAIRHASETYMKGIIGYTANQVVSTDLIGNSCPCIFDETAGIMLDNDFVKLIAWYDNEWGYSNMVVRLLEHMVAVDEGRVTPEKRVVPKDKPKEEPAAKEA